MLDGNPFAAVIDDIVTIHFLNQLQPFVTSESDE